MPQSLLEEMIAKATGDDLRDIRRLGFQIADPHEVNFDPEPVFSDPRTVDWDEVDLIRNVAVF